MSRLVGDGFSFSVVPAYKNHSVFLSNFRVGSVYFVMNENVKKKMAGSEDFVRMIFCYNMLDNALNTAVNVNHFGAFFLFCVIHKIFVTSWRPIDFSHKIKICIVQK